MVSIWALLMEKKNLTSGHRKKTKKTLRKQDSAIQIQIFQPTFSSAMPPANTVMKEKSHSPKAPAAAPACRSLRGAIYTALGATPGGGF